jgi:outer membrane protein assembly factor BamB
VVGPEKPERTKSVEISEALVLNSPPAIDEEGVMYWGTWGLVRSTQDSSDPKTWDKLDGSVRSVDSNLQVGWGDRSAVFDENEFCYEYLDREDLTWCPDGGEVTYHNGIVDSTPTLTGDGAAWVTRGDGRLYEVDLADGSAELMMMTWNPDHLEDPDGGGGLLSSPLALPDGGILVASVGAGPYETNAIYAVNRMHGVRWRLPSIDSGYPAPFWAAPALSPDGDVAYVASWVGPGFNDSDQDLTEPGLLLAIDLGVPDSATDDDRILWQEAPVTEDGDPLYVRTMSVGAQGNLYLGGLASETQVAWVVAYSSDGTWLWGTSLDFEDTEMVRGLALQEINGEVVRVYATTGHRASSLRGGRLHALDPQDGAQDGTVAWTFDPEQNGGKGAPSGMAVDAEGTVYFATQGTSQNGTVYAVDSDGLLKWKYCRENYEGAHPILTPEGNLVVGEGSYPSCALTAPTNSTCRSSSTDRVVRVFYADIDPDARFDLPLVQCCRCTTGSSPVGGVPFLAFLLLAHRRRSHA